MAARLIDVAKEAGVSRVLAGQVLLGGKPGNIRFSAETAEKVRMAAEKLGYAPNHTARQLRGVRSETIGVVMPVIESNILFSNLRAFVCHASAKGYGVLVREMPGDDDGFLEVLKDFVSRQMEGILSFDRLPPGFAKSAAYLQSTKMRTVFCMDALGAASTYNVDLSNGIEQAVDHLVENGYEKIALFLNDVEEISMLLRLRGYKSGLMKNGIAFDSGLVWSADIRDNIADGDPRYAESVARGAKTLVGDAGADAIIMSNDIWALHMAKHLTGSELRVPEDVGLVGMDNISAAFLCSPQLTSIEQRLDELMVELMDFFIQPEGGSEPRNFSIKPRLVVRESTMRQKNMPECS